MPPNLKLQKCQSIRKSSLKSPKSTKQVTKRNLRARVSKICDKAASKRCSSNRKLTYLTRDQTAVIKSYFDSSPEWKRPVIQEWADELNVPYKKVYKWGVDYKRKSMINMMNNITEHKSKEVVCLSILTDPNPISDYNKAVDDIIDMYANNYAYLEKMQDKVVGRKNEGSPKVKNAVQKTQNLSESIWDYELNQDETLLSIKKECSLLDSYEYFDSTEGVTNSGVLSNLKIVKSDEDFIVNNTISVMQFEVPNHGHMFTNEYMDADQMYFDQYS